MGDKLKVLVVDDSLVYRNILTRAVEDTGLAEVKYTASNGEIALERLEQGEIDVILLDVYMPKLNGLEVLRIIKEKYEDKPVIMISSGGKDSAELTVKALEMGAMDFILKPSGSNMERNMERIKSYLHILFAQILTKKYSNVFKEAAKKRMPSKQSTDFKMEGKGKITSKPYRCEEDRSLAKVKLEDVDLILIASSTGGPMALEKVLTALPSDIDVPILIVQHMPPTFTKMLAETLDKKSKLSVREGKAGCRIEPGVCILAPGGFHMVIGNKGGLRVIDLEDTPPVHGVKPAADVLFSSVAEHYRGRDVLAIVLTGMGSDGTDGVRKLKSYLNCYCITQSRESCVVYGMPKSVYEAGLSDEEVHIDDIGGRIIDIVSGRG